MTQQQTIDVTATNTTSVRSKTHAAPFGYYKTGKPRQIPIEAEQHTKVPFLAEFIEKAYNLALLQHSPSDRDLADYFNTTPAMIQTWKEQYPEFREAILSGGVEADALVARALHDRAKGGTYKTNEVVKIKEDRYTERVEIIEVEKTLPADVSAAQNWLKNRSVHWQKDALISDPSSTPQIANEEVARRIAFLLAKAEATQTPITVNIDNRQQSVTLSPPSTGGSNT